MQETLLTLLTQQLEHARLIEARDLPIVQVLDRATPAERHIKPRLRLNLAIAGMISLVGAISLVLLLEQVKVFPRPAQHA